MTLFLWFYLFWLGFVFAMAARAAWDDLAWFVKLLVAPPVLAVVCIDVWTQWTIANVLFWDWAHEVTFTQRLGRYKRGDSRWRKAVATFICRYFLDVFQVGGHCA